MIILDATTKTLQVLLSGAVTTNELPITSAFVDITTTTFAPGESDTVSNGGTAVTAVAAPGASTQRQVKSLAIYNADTVAATVTVRYNNNGTTRILCKVVLAVASSLIYTDGVGFRVITTAGEILSDAGTVDQGAAGASAWPVTGPLTDAQLRATAVPVSSTTLATAAKQDTGNTSLASLDTKLPSQGQAVAAASVPVVLTAAQITTLTPPAAITGFSTEATLALIKAKTDNIDVALSTRTKPADTQPVSAASLPLPSGATTEATLATRLSESDYDTKTGSLTETAPATDTASSGLNGRLQRIAQRITSLIALVPAALVGGRFDVNVGAVPDGSDATQGVTTGAAVVTDANGTLQQYLRGIVKLLITSGTIVLGAGTAAIGKLAANSGVDIGDVDVTSLPALVASSAVIGVVNPQGYFVTATTSITRPSDTNNYAINDALSDSTSAPTTGGFTLTGMGRASGKSGVITDAIITSSADASTLLQGEIWIFDAAVTNVNDNAALVVSDSEIQTYVGKIPFTLEDAGNNGSAHIQNLNIGYTCVGSANLRFLVKVKNVYTPASAEVITVRIKAIQVD